MLVLAAGLLLGVFAAPALAAPVDGARYEGVYDFPAVPFRSTGNAQVDQQVFVKTEERLLGNILSDVTPPGLTPAIDFQVNRTGTLAAFQADVEVRSDTTADRAFVRLVDAPGPGDDIPLRRLPDNVAKFVARNGDEVVSVPLSGTIQLNGQSLRIGADSVALISGTFADPPTTGRAARVRPSTECMVGALAVVVNVQTAAGPLTLDSDILPHAAQACRRPDGSLQAACRRRASGTAAGAALRRRGARSRGLRRTARRASVLVKGAPRGAQPSELASLLARFRLALG